MISAKWKKLPLDHVAYIQTGLAKGKTDIKNPRTVPYLRVANVQDGYLDLSLIKLIEVEESNIDRYLLKPGDVLLTEGGDFDKLGRGAIWQGEINPCLHQNHIFVVRPKDELLMPEFLSHLTGSAYGKSYFLKCSKQSTNLASINSTQLKEFPVLLPPLMEQKKIVEAIHEWDYAIEKNEGLIAAKKRKLKGFIKKLIINNPEKKRWGKYPLGNFVIERKEKSSVHNQYPTITSSRRGIFLQEEYFSKQVTSSDNSSYKIIKKGDFTFRSMSDDGIFVFNRLLQIDIGIISPAYGVFYADGVDPDYLYYFLNSSDFKRALVGESQGGTRTALKLSAIKRINVGLPIYNVQKTIAAILNIAQQEIDLLKKQLDAYRKQKRGLMQKLLTGQWRVKK
jgi:type I restriction enzyme S subunit